MIKNLLDILQTTDSYLSYLKDKIEFSKNGFPVFESWMFSDSVPDQIIPYNNRHNKVVKSPQNTTLCFYSGDQFLYPRLERVFDDIPEYKQYLAVIGLDVTVTSDMDQEWQDAIMLLNQLFLAVLACNGIKIIPNARMGSKNSLTNFSGMPKKIIYATSFLGCSNLSNEHDFSFISKMLYLMPSMLLIYGKHDIIAESQLNTMGIPYLIYPDFHRICKGVA